MLKIVKTYDNPNAASGYKGTAKNLIAVNPYHAEDYSLSIGSIIISTLSFRNNQLFNYSLNTTETSEDGTSIYFTLVGKSYEEVISLIKEWLMKG